MIEIIDLGDQIGIKLPADAKLSPACKKELRGTRGLCAHLLEGSADVWTTRRDNYRHLWRWLQRYFAGSTVTCPKGEIVVDGSPGIVNSLGLANYASTLFRR